MQHVHHDGLTHRTSASVLKSRHLCLASNPVGLKTFYDLDDHVEACCQLLSLPSANLLAMGGLRFQDPVPNQS